MAEKKEKQLLGAQTEDKLMQYILQTPIEIGAKIPNEFELAEMFDVGRSTIREAVKGLVTRGILEVRRGSGTFVTHLSAQQPDILGLRNIKDNYRLALDVFDVRLMIEPEICALACKNATEDDLERLKQLCDETEALYKKGCNHMTKDIAFHQHIALCSKNHVAQHLLPAINIEVTPFANLTHWRLMEETLHSHREITQAILRRDSMGARCAMTMHLTYNRQTIVALIAEREK